jgi:hypothetical protein
MADIVLHHGQSYLIEGEDAQTGIADDHTLPKGKLYSICFKPGGTSDELVMKDGGENGPDIFDAKVTAVTEEQIIYYGWSLKQPFLDQSECTLSAGAKVIITHEPLDLDSGDV